MSNIEPKPTDGFTSSEFPKNSKAEESVKSIIEKRLGSNNLLLAIIETVTISKLKGIGETIYLAHKPIDYIEGTIHKDYKKIIEEINKTKFGSPIRYYNWYEREKHFYVIHQNETPVSLDYSILNPHIIEPSENESETLKENYKDIIEDKILTDEDLASFYITYTKCFIKKEWFKELPHYFILAKPISVPDMINKSFIPLGNLYVVIGTKEKVGIDIYQELVKDLRAFWFHRFGSKILREHSQKKRSDAYKPKTDLSKTLQTKLSRELFKNGGEKIALDDFFYYAFDLDNYAHHRDSHLFYSNHTFIKKLSNNYNNKSEIEKIIKETYNYKNDSLNVLNKSADGLKRIDEDSIKYFLLLLSKRRLALALILVFNFNLEEAHKALVFGEREKIGKDHDGFFSTELFITNSTEIKKLIPLIADREELFLINIVKEIKKSNPSFTCKIYT